MLFLVLSTQICDVFLISPYFSATYNFYMSTGFHTIQGKETEGCHMYKLLKTD